MKAMKWIGWCGMVLLVGSLMWTTGCGGSDGDGGSTTVIVTNVPPGVAPISLVAPQLVSPVDGEKFGTLLLFAPVDVEFEWTVVPGAESYILEVGGTEYPLSGIKHKVSLSIGKYNWRVWAVAAGTAGPKSSQRSVEVELTFIQIQP